MAKEVRGPRPVRQMVVGGLVLGLVLASGVRSSVRAEMSGPEILQALEDTFAAVAEKVRPAVVHLTVERVENEADPLLERLPPELRERLPLPRPEERPVQGSGMIFRQEGNTAYLLTNAHVVHGAKDNQVMVKLLGEKEKRPGAVVGEDPYSDLAVIKMEIDKALPVITFGNTDQLRVGTWVMAIGSPFSTALEFEATVTVGVVSGKERSIPDPGNPRHTYRHLIQTDAPINPGNSGGPLVNMQGEVVGINSAIFTTTGANMGLGFAVSIDQATRVVDMLIREGKVTRGWLGVGIWDIQDYAIDLGVKVADAAEMLGVNEGAIVREVFDDSPAQVAGLQALDVIIEFDGQKVTSADQLVDLVTITDPNRQVPLKVVREGKEQTLTVQTGIRPAEADTGVPGPPKKEARLGLTVSELTDERRAELELGDRPGVVVESVEPDSPAVKAGLKEGDVILSVRGPDRIDHPVANPDEFWRLLDELKDARLILLKKLTVEDGQTKEVGVFLVPQPEE